MKLPRYDRQIDQQVLDETKEAPFFNTNVPMPVPKRDQNLDFLNNIATTMRSAAKFALAYNQKVSNVRTANNVNKAMNDARNQWNDFVNDNLKTNLDYGTWEKLASDQLNSIYEELYETLETDEERAMFFDKYYTFKTDRIIETRDQSTDLSISEAKNIATEKADNLVEIDDDSQFEIELETLINGKDYPYEPAYTTGKDEDMFHEPGMVDMGLIAESQVEGFKEAIRKRREEEKRKRSVERTKSIARAILEDNGFEAASDFITDTVSFEEAKDNPEMAGKYKNSPDFTEEEREEFIADLYTEFNYKKSYEAKRQADIDEKAMEQFIDLMNQDGDVEKWLNSPGVSEAMSSGMYHKIKNYYRGNINWEYSQEERARTQRERVKKEISDVLFSEGFHDVMAESINPAIITNLMGRGLSNEGAVQLYNYYLRGMAAGEGRNPYEESNPEIIYGFYKMYVEAGAEGRTIPYRTGLEYIKNNMLDAQNNPNISTQDVKNLLNFAKTAAEDPTYKAGLDMLVTRLFADVEDLSPAEQSELFKSASSAITRYTEAYSSGEYTTQTVVDFAEGFIKDQIDLDFEKALTDNITGHFNSRGYLNSAEQFVDLVTSGAFIGLESEMKRTRPKLIAHMDNEYKKRFNQLKPGGAEFRSFVEDSGLLQIVIDTNGDAWTPYIRNNKVEYRRWDPGSDRRKKIINQFILSDDTHVGFDLDAGVWKKKDPFSDQWTSYGGEYLTTETGEKVPIGVPEEQYKEMIERAREEKEQREAQIEAQIEEFLSRGKEGGLISE